MTVLVADDAGGVVRFSLLGSLEVVDSSGTAWTVSAAKQRVILAALLLGRGRLVSAASLAEALWDGPPPPNESAVLRTYVMRLRQTLGPVGPRIVGRLPSWAVDLRGPAELDLAEVDRLRLAARAEASVENWTEASALLTTALSRWRGEPLIDVPSVALWRRAAGMLAELRVGLLEARIDADLRLGRHGELVAELRQLVAEHPLREHFRVQLMTACFGSGQQAAALEAYQDAYRTLADDLGLEPGRELQEIHQRILSGDRTVAEVPAALSIHHRAASIGRGSPSQSHLSCGATGAGAPHSGRGHAAVTAGSAVPPANGSPDAWLRESRQVTGLTQQQVAERSGLPARTISDLEQGVSAWPDPGSIEALTEALGLPQAQADEVAARYGNAGMARAVPRQLPAAPRYFVGRRSELASLRTQLRKMAAAGGVVISGMAGAGKTALALHWAHQVAREFPDGQLFADLGGFSPSGTPVKPAAALHGFLDGLGVPAERMPRSLAALAGLYRSVVAGRRMLIVLDNARDVEQVWPLLPGSPGCLVLVTSRARMAGLAVGGNAELLALDVLSDAEARELLAVRLGAARVAAEPDAVSELIGLCAGLPLAVAIAAARAVAHPAFPLAGLNAELRDAARRLDGLDAGDAASNVRTVVSWSYRQLAELPARMLQLLSVHPGPGITAAAAASMAGIPIRQARKTLLALAEVNLITEYLPGRYALHDLLRSFAAEQAQVAMPAEDQRAAIGRMLDHYLHTVTAVGVVTWWERDPVTLAALQPGVMPETLAARDEALAWLDAEYAVLVKVTGQAAETGFDVHAWQLAWSLAVFFRMRGHWHDLVATQRIGLAAARRLGDLGAQACIHRELGSISGQAGRFREAHSHLARALQLCRALGDQNGQARTHLTIGQVQASHGRHREALDCALDALHVSAPGRHPPGSPATSATHAMTLNNLGWYHARLGELDQARTRCEHALQLFRGIRSQYGQAFTSDSLGFIYHQLGDDDQAAGYYQLAADQYRQLGDLHHLAETLDRLGDSYEAAHEIAAARDAWQQALHILDGMQHPDARKLQARLRQLDAVDSQAG